MREIWKPVAGYEGLYEVSNLGRVKSNQTGILLAQSYNQKGYLKVHLYNDRKRKSFFVHRIVAQTFVPNCENLPQVNHKDGNKTNNHATNLEWCTPAENIRHAIKAGLWGRYAASVQQYSKDGSLICIYKNAECAHEKTGVDVTGIRRCCSGERKTAGGYIWRYADESVQATSA